MACYAAVLSVFHTSNNINNHPRPPISIDQKQLHSLNPNLTFFQHFLENYSGQEEEVEDLEGRIASAAYAAEDVIETHIVDQILPVIFRFKLNGFKFKFQRHVFKFKFKRHGFKFRRHGSVELYGDLERVIQDMDLIREKIMRPQELYLDTNSSSVSSTWQSSSSSKPVFEEAFVNEVLDKLTGQQSGLQVIPIIGMGGIGKTTFAKFIYKNPLIVQYFDILAWVTISQEYSRANILKLLCQETKGSTSGLSEMSENELGLILYKHLCGRRYLIVMDDIWSGEAWDEVKSFFPDSNGSRIMITTRLSNLALELSGGHIFRMQFLDEDKSWNLLCEVVFGKVVDYPIELEKIGKEIARKCRGLPLSITVIGGLLKKSRMTLAYWVYTLDNLNLLINLENDEYTLRILRTSYKELPMHLKPCFLYMGIFPKDYVIKVSFLIKFWVAEGIIRPIDDKSLEAAGKEYLKELIDRNLILIHILRWDGKATMCKMHDLLRDVCSREAQKQNLFHVSRQQNHHTPQVIGMECRICIYPENIITKYSPQFLRAVESASLARSFLCKDDINNASPSIRFRLLRVYSRNDGFSSCVEDPNHAIFEQANLRYLSLSLYSMNAESRFLSLWSLLWNLQTLIVGGVYKLNIWEMPLLRHVKVYSLELSDPPNGEHNFVMENLQTLSVICNFKFSEEVVKKIPNIRKLKLKYNMYGLDEVEGLSNFCLYNLGCFQKLKSLNIEFTFPRKFGREIVLKNLVSFPRSLKKLNLKGTRVNWEELTIRIGSLPLLQVLALYKHACMGPKWETFEGQFCNLKFLTLFNCYDLKCWETDSSHFPRLEHLHLHLHDLKELEQIPPSIGDISTLKSIQIMGCSKSTEDSIKRIQVEQQENGNEDLQVENHISMLETMKLFASSKVVEDFNKKIQVIQGKNGNGDLKIKTVYDTVREILDEEDIL